MENTIIYLINYANHVVRSFITELLLAIRIPLVYFRSVSITLVKQTGNLSARAKERQYENI